jgi:hypothetical protein
MEKRLEEAAVRRLTVDEKLSDDLIRLLVCPLAAGRKEFRDEPDEWGVETSVAIVPANYVAVMRIPDEIAGNYPWGMLREGQVYLSGSFLVKGDEKSPAGFVVVSEGRNFLRIDDLVKRRIKKLYFDALEGGEPTCQKK